MAQLVILAALFLLVSVNAGSNGDNQITLEDIERDLSGPNRMSSNLPNKNPTPAVQSPTKFGFVPVRTAAAYSATKPKNSYFQSSIRIKSPNSNKTPSVQFQYVTPQYSTAQNSQYYNTQSSQYSNPQNSQYVSISNPSQYASTSSKYTPQQQQYSTTSYSQQYPQDTSSYSQQYAPSSSSAGQQYAYIQPASKQQDYQQQYPAVQYVNDNSLTQSDSQQQQQYYAQSPQYYYVQQYQAPSSAVETVVDPKGGAYQYVTYVPSYSPNSVPSESKYQDAYRMNYITETTVPTKHYSKYSASKQNGGRQKAVRYNIEVPQTPASSITAPAPQQQQQQQYYSQEQQYLVKREPKSLLDSYVPSYLQLKYLKDQERSEGGDIYSKY